MGGGGGGVVTKRITGTFSKTVKKKTRVRARFFCFRQGNNQQPEDVMVSKN